jgi:hypothetical protein
VLGPVTRVARRYRKTEISGTSGVRRPNVTVERRRGSRQLVIANVTEGNGATALRKLTQPEHI